MLEYFMEEKHHLYRCTIKEFVEKEIKPNIDEWEEQGEVPRELFLKAGDLGFFGFKFEKEEDGGRDIIAQGIWLEEIAVCGCGGVPAALGAHVEIGLPPVYHFGNAVQKEKFLIPGIKGEKIAALAVTEPDAGSDVASIATIARREKDNYIVNGTKIFITNGVISDFVVLAVKTDMEAGYNGISLLLVEKGTPGFTVSRKLDKLGWRSSDTAELSFQDCAVPAENLLGEENKGFYYIMKNFEWERLSLAIGSVASAEAVIKITIDYMKGRKQFGRSISNFQALRHRMADHIAAVQAAKQLCHSVLIKLSRGEDNLLKESIAAKLFSGNIVGKVMDDCLQFHGGYGYMMEYPVQRYLRDSRIMPIGGGTSEIMRQVLAAQYMD